MGLFTRRYTLPAGYSTWQTLRFAKQFLQDPLALVTKSMERFNGTYSSTVAGRKFIITQDPEFISYVLKDHHINYQKSVLATKSVVFLGEGLLFSNGAYWLKQRRLMQPAFHKEKMKGFQTIIANSVNDFIKDLSPGNNIDVAPLMHRLTFRLLLQSIFDINMPVKLEEEISEIFRAIQDFLLTDTNHPLGRLLYPFTKQKSVALAKAKRLRNIFREIIEERRKDETVHDDLLDMLLQTRYEDTQELMTDQQIINELIIMVFAGHETSANTLSWLLYLLSVNPQALQKLVDSLNGTTVENCLQNTYLTATIKEAMRMYPAAWMTERAAIADDSFNGYHYPKRTIIILFLYGAHRDAKHWTAPEEFQPERFLGDGNVNTQKKYFPFGAGPRMCIGNNFAMMEMSVFLTRFFQQFTIGATGQVPKTIPRITLSPDHVQLDLTLL